LLEQRDRRLADSAARSLVGVGRVREAIAQDPAAGLQRGLNEVREVHGASGKHQQQLCERGQRLVTPLQYQVANGLGQRCSAGLACHHWIDTASTQSLRGMKNLRRLADALDALESHEAACS
jgi:hypothetical protein